MFAICTNCGEYNPDKEVDPAGPHVLCPSCGYKHEFRMLPLFVITGASGTGKSVIWSKVLLAEPKPDLVYLESDILWRAEFAKSEDAVLEYRDLWLDVCCNISQSGRPVALFGSASPAEYEKCRMRKYFSKIHYLAVVCDKAVLQHRLQNRPGWRQSSTPEKVAEHLAWNQWFIDNKGKAEPEFSTLDTSDKSPEQCAKDFFDWVAKTMREYGL